MLLLLQRMVVSKIEEIDSRDRIRAVRLLYGYITDKEKCKLKWHTEGEGGIYLLSYYLANKRSLYIRSQGLEIPTLIEEK